MSSVKYCVTNAVIPTTASARGPWPGSGIRRLTPSMNMRSFATA